MLSMTNLAEAATTPHERRRHERVAVDVPATVASGGAEQSARLRDVAAGGVFVASSAAAAPGARVVLRFRMLRQRVCEAAGVVVRCGSSEHGFAVAFEHTNPAMDSFVHSLARLPEHLRVIYLADVIDPRVELS
jgi:hypothetical protein